MSDPGAWPPPNPPASPPPTYPWPGWQPPQQAWWPGPPVRPPAMDRAVRLLWLGAGLTVVATVVNAVLTDPGDVGAGTSFGRGDRPLDDSTVSAITYASAAVTVLITVGLWLWMAWANGRGKTWARTVATVLACVNGGFWAIGFVSLLVIRSGFSGQSWADRLIGQLLSLAALAAGLIALWLMYRPESSAFYTASSTPQPPAGWPGYHHPYYPPAYPPAPAPYPPPGLPPTTPGPYDRPPPQPGG